MASQSPSISPASSSSGASCLVHPLADFWLLGGASLVIWLVLMATLAMPPGPTQDHIASLLGAGIGLQILVNYPHFMASYRLGYTRGWGFIRTHWFALLVVPFAILGALALSWIWYSERNALSEAIFSLGEGLRGVGFETYLGKSHQAGRELLGLLGHVLFFTVGWHYSKQIFGCMMVMAKFDGYPLQPAQRDGIRRGLFTIWAAAYFHLDLARIDLGRLGISVPSLGFPPIFDTLSEGLWLLAVVWFCLRVVRANRIRHGLWPSANFLVPAVAFSVWWIPTLAHDAFRLSLVPFFHSLQYLPFIYKVERGRYRRAPRRSPQLQVAVLVLGLIAVGLLGFVVVPEWLDRAFDSSEKVGGSFFLFGISLFLNVHHYFVDSVLWKFQDAEIREHLLAPSRPPGA